MLAKSNRVERLKQTMDQKPTFGFRKLSIGITSVMLGVTFFMAGGHTVFAETSTSQTTENKTITNNQTTNTQSNIVEQSKDPTSTDQTSQTQTNNENQTQNAKVDQSVSATDTISNDKAKSTTSAPDTATEKATSITDPTAATSTNTGDKASTETNTPNSAHQITRFTANSKVAPKSAAATATPATTNSDLAVTDDNGITLSIDRNTVGNDGTDGAPININLSGTFQAGEVYGITVPVTTFGIDDSNFNNTIIANRGVISKSDQTVDGQKYRDYKLTVSNDFTTTTGFKLVIPDGNNYTARPAATSSNAIDPAGEVKREISWGYVDSKKGEVKNKSLYFTTIIKDSMHPTFNQVKPSPNKVTQLQTNTNYDFQLNINQTTGLQNDTSYGSNKVNSAVNMGTTITIPVPGDFVIDPDASLRASGLVPDGKTTITQEKAGADIVIKLAAGTGSQNWTGATGYHLVGKFMQPVGPYENKTYTADRNIKIDQKVRTVDGISTISATINHPWSVNLVGPKVTPKQGDLATQIVGNNGSNTLIQKQATNIVNYFGFKNDTSISFTNSLHIQVGFDENLAVTGIKTPDINATLRPGLTSYQYIIEVVDKATQKHRFITASVDAGQVIAAPTGTTIYKADILPNYVEVGATTKMGSDLSKIPDSNSGSTTQNEDPDVFEAYGYISDKLNNMETLPPDTTVSTKIAIQSADFNDNQPANSAVKQKVLGLDSLTAAMQAWGYQNSTMYDPKNPTKSAGSIDMHFDLDPNATTVKVFEPIFYYVLPKYFSFSGGWDAIQDKAKDANTGKVIEPKFETYMVDGRQVVKLDYTGTGFNYNTNDSQSHDRLYITIDPDGVAGDYYYDAFVYTKSGMSHYTTKYTATNLDDQTKAFTKNITNSDIPGSLYKLSYLYGNRFTIKSPVIAYVANMAQGNEDPKAAVKGTSDTKGDGTMYYYVNVANYDVNAIKDGMLLINVPLASDNSNSFDFAVDGPVTYDGSYDKTFDNGFTFYYANDVQRLPSTKEKGIQPSLDNYVTGDQVKDWSKVKSIIVKFTKDIPAVDQIGRFVIKGHDPSFKADAGKTGYIRVALTGSNFTPFVSTDTGIQIVGKSTIDTRLHYVDANGKDQYIEVPSMAKTYAENKDVMNLADFDPKNIPSTLIPENYELSSSIPQFIITNSDDEAQNAGFGKQVKYYFNGDIVQFELKHKHEQVNRSVTYERTVNFVDETGKQMADPEKQTLTFNQTGDKDLATGTIKWVPVDSQSFEEVAAKNVAGYTSDKQAISAETVMPSDGDFSENHTENLKITYKADPQTVKVVYVDDDNNGSQIGNTQTVSGVTDETVSTNISNPDSTKYEIVDGDKLPETVTLKPADERVVTVHLKHKHTPVNRSVTYERTVNFVDETGKQMADPEKQTLTFNQTGDKDLATGTIKWVPVDSQSFEEVAAKNVAGYTSDKQAISAETVMPSDGDFSENHTENLKITYKADPQTVKVVYVDDDNNGATIDSGTITGKTGQTVPTNVVNPDDTKYELVPGYETEITFGPDKHPEVIVHVRHKKENVTRTKDVTLTVTFELPDGTQVKKTATINFIQNGVKDLATGETTWQGDYQASSKFATITAPEVPGYHPTSTAGGQVITVNTNNWDKDLDLNQVITYEADPSNQPDIPITPSEPVSPGNQPDQNTPSPKLEPTTPATPDDKPAKPTTNDKPNKGKPHVQGLEEHGHQATRVTQPHGEAQEHGHQATRVTQPHGEAQGHARRVAQPNVEQQAQGQLPQTGEKETQAGLLGLALVGLSSLLALLGVKKKEDK